MKMEFFPGCESIKADILGSIKSSFPVPLRRTGDPLWGRVPKLPINFEEIVSRAHTNFEEQNKISESSIIIINYCITIINAQYSYIKIGQ